MHADVTNDDLLNDPAVVEAAIEMTNEALEGAIAGATLMRACALTLAHLCADGADPEEELEAVLAELRGNAREILAALLSEDDDDLIEDESEPVGTVQ